MAENRKSLGVHLRIPLDAVGAFMVWLGDRAPAWGFEIVEAVSPNTPHPKASRLKAQGADKALHVRSRAAAPEANTMGITLGLFRKAHGKIVTRSEVAAAFTEAGYNPKTAQTTLDRLRTSKKIERVEKGKYRWVAPEVA